MVRSRSFYRDNASLNPFLGVVKVVVVFHWWFLVSSLSPMLSLLSGFYDGFKVMRVVSYSLFSTPSLDMWVASYVVTFRLASDYVAQKGSWCILLSCFHVVGSWFVDLFSWWRSSSFADNQNLGSVLTKVHTPLFFQFGFALVRDFAGLCIWCMVVCSGLGFTCFVVVSLPFGLICITFLDVYFSLSLGRVLYR